MTSIWVKLRNINLWITAFFLLSVYPVSDTLISEHDIGTYAYFSYPILMLIARFYPNKKIAYYSALLSFSIIIIGNMIEPLEMDSIEESFIVIPLTYIILYPGSLWPIASAILLLLSYTMDLPASEFDEFIEDALELLAISGFASVMSFYQKKLRTKMVDYKKDSETDFLTQLNNRKKFYFDLSQI